MVVNAGRKGCFSEMSLEELEEARNRGQQHRLTSWWERGKGEGNCIVSAPKTEGGRKIRFGLT